MTTIILQSPDLFKLMSDAVKNVPDGWAVSWDIQSFCIDGAVTWFVLIWGDTKPGADIDIEIIRDNAPDLPVAIAEVLAEFGRFVEAHK